MSEERLINIERRFRPEIEGLRFVAAMLVAVYHIWLNRVSGGVDVFFVISGFLITTSIISRINRTGELNFSAYIKGLLKRLLPSSFFVLGITLVLSILFLPKSIYVKTLKEIFASMFFYQNWQLAITNTDYLDASQMKSPVEHFWALSIQGQFYLIWFFLFTGILLLIKKYNKISIVRLMNISFFTIFIISLGISVYITKVNQPLAYFITFTRLWEFALGGLLCLNISKLEIRSSISQIIGWIGLIGLLLTGIIFDVSEKFPGYIALWPMLCAVFILVSSEKDTRFGVKKFLGNPIMIKLGSISFGIYLWHWVLLSFYRYMIQSNPSLSHGILIILVSIALSYIMTELVEKPIRLSKDDKKSFTVLGAMGTINLVIIMVFTSMFFFNNKNSVAIEIEENYPGAAAVFYDLQVPESEYIPELEDVFGDLPLAHLDGSNQGLRKSDLKIGEYNAVENYDFTIALIGSSHTEHWQGAVLEAVKNYSNIRVLNITRSATRFSTGYKDDELKRTWIGHVLDYLKDADIDLILSQATVSNIEEYIDHQQIIDQFKFVKENYGIDILAIRDVPRYSFNILESLEINGEEKTIEMMNEDNIQKDESFWNNFLNNDTMFYKFDPSPYFMFEGEFRPIIGNIVVYRDNRHLTNTYSKSFGPIFEKEILSIIKEINPDFN